ncbi:MAG: DUF4058 family protein [Caldilineaceae bacterium]
MPLSPFPGMDPYLEASAKWSSVHTRLITAISDQLSEQLGSAYSVDIEQRVYILTADEARKYVVPDIFLVQSPLAGTVATGTGAVTPPTLVEPVLDLEVRERYIQIVDSSDDTVVTTIEILSPFNKQGDSPGRRAFVDKRNTVMASSVHWIEIDLLCGGERPPEVVEKSDYYVLLKRGGVWGPLEVWYIDLRDRLPVIAVPLRAPDPDAPLDLQAMLEGIYQRGRYFEKLDYAKTPPAPRLRPADVAWTKERVQLWANATKLGK